MDHRQYTNRVSHHPRWACRQFRRCLWIVAPAFIALQLSWHQPAAFAEPLLEPTPVVEGPVQYVGPDTYILLDGAGRPQPMLGMKYDDFMAAWKKVQNLESQTSDPRFVIESIRLDGEVHGEHAELAGKIVVRQMVDAQITVPLGLAGAILQQQPKCATVEAADASTAIDTQLKKASSIVDYDGDRGGFVARLSERKGDRCEITLSMLVPLVRDGKQTSLRLNLAKSTVSNLKLDVGTTIGAVTATSGSVLTKEATATGSTRLSLTGLASDLQVTWSAVEQQQAELATVLSAVGNELISIDGHSIRTDIRLKVRSYGGGFDRFHVRLPSVAKLIQERRTDATGVPPNYRVTLGGNSADDDASVDGRRGDQIATVEFAEKQSEAVDVDLSTEQPLGDSGADRTMELSGFEVLGAVRQYGSLAVRVADNWQLRWDASANVRQVERIEQPGNLQQSPPTAAFEYDRQPWSLHARLEPRPIRIHVTPDYKLDLGPDEAQLRVHLNYQIPGARTFEFRVKLRGWDLTPDAIESSGLVDQDRIVVSREGELILPLGQASARRADVSFSLRRSLPRDQTRLELPMPTPEADSVGTADLVVRTAADVELMPDLARGNGMSPTPVASDSPLPTFDDGRQEFHFRSLLPDATFAATRTVRQRDVTGETSTKIFVDRNQIRATQTIDVLVRFQPLGQLTLEIPEPWSLDGDSLEVLSAQSEVAGNGGESETSNASSGAALTNQGLVTSVSTEGTVSANGSNSLIVTLPQTRLGRFAIRVRYVATLPADMVSVGGLKLPLPLLKEGRLSKQELSISSSAETLVRLDPAANTSAWLIDNVPAGDSGGGTLDLRALGSQNEVPLSIRTVENRGPQPAAVDRIWLETWLSGNVIQDRAAFRFTSGGSAVTVELPPQAVAGEVETLLDGQLADVSGIEGRLVVAIPATDAIKRTGLQPHTLELRYRRQRNSDLFEGEQLTPPQLVGTSPLSQTYWQLVLPTDEQLLESPSQLVPLDQWRWLGTFFGRRPTKTQTDLENWVGATRQLPPSDSQSEYLFGGFMPAASIEIVIVPRWTIVLAASVMVFAAVIGRIFLPRRLRTWVSLALVTILGALSVAYPSSVAIVGEASLLGILAAAIATVIHRRLSRPSTRPATNMGSTNMRVRTSTRIESSFARPHVTPSQPPQTSPTPSSKSAATAFPVNVQDTH